MKTPTPSEILKLEAALIEFSYAQLLELEKGAKMGARGWDNPKFTEHHMDQLNELVLEDTSKYIDIANYAMFLWYLDKKGKESG